MAGWRLLTALLLAGLAGCASHRAPRLPATYYQGPLTVTALRADEGLTLMPVTAPSQLRFAAVTSHLPFYGLNTPLPDPHIFGGRPAPAVTDLLDVSALLLPPLRQTLQATPGLAARLRDNPTGQARLQLSIDRLALLGKDTSDRRCEVLVVLQARVLGADGQLRWHGGRVSTQSDDRHTVACADVLADRRLLAQAVSDSLLRSERELLQRLSGAASP